MLSQVQSGDHQAPEEHLPLFYDNMPRLAAACLANERADHMLQATALANSAICSTGKWQS
jgi:hypothetical protein